MFTGSINQDMRSLIKTLAVNWKGREVYVPCSGNFTVERVLNTAGVTKVYGCDVSLYTCVIGGYLSGENVTVSLNPARPEFSWLAEYLTPGIDTVISMVLSTRYMQFIDRQEPYFTRMERAYREAFSSLHAENKEKLQPLLDEIQIAGFSCADAMEFIKEVPSDAVVLSFPPTYAGGYEKLYKNMDSVFEWDKPTYEVFTAESFELFMRRVMQRDTWVLARDNKVAELEEHLVAQFQTGMRSRPVYMYSSAAARTYLTVPRQKLEPVHQRRLAGDIEGPMKLIAITQGQFNTLRSLYLSPKIIPASAHVRLAVICGDSLVGAFAFDRSKYGSSDEVYMMTDFAISPTKYKRLSKLVLAAALSTEVQGILESTFNQRVLKIFTTAFTDNPASMKYRGMLDVHNRKEGIVNYEGHAGRWTLEEGFEWWMEKHSKSLRN